MSQKYFTTLDTLKSLTYLFAALIITTLLGSVAYVYVSLSALSVSVATAGANISSQEKSAARSDKELGELKIIITNQDRDASKELARQGRDIAKLEGIVDALVKQNQKLAGLIEKQKDQGMAEILRGILIGTKDDHLTIMSANKIMAVFLVPKNTRIFHGDTEITFAELELLKNHSIRIFITIRGEHLIYVIDQPKKDSKAASAT